MDQYLNSFHDEVVLKYHLYNGLFLTLPFGNTQETGTLLSVFAKHCQTEITKGQSPKNIINHFFKHQLPCSDEHNLINHLFKMLQFIERQIVLFDALEDAAFTMTHDITGKGSLQNLIKKVEHTAQQQRFTQQITDYQIKIVLTAHPTQFYPSQVLSILTQLTSAIRHNDFKQVNLLLQQMGKTSFRHLEKPTPYQEAHSLVWYLENTFYPVISKIQLYLDNILSEFGSSNSSLPNCIDLGFWPGGDRDGNPNVTPEITRQVARLLKTRILSMYRQDLRKLVKKLTFEGILDRLENIRTKLEHTYLASQLTPAQNPSTDIYKSAAEMLSDLHQLRILLMDKHNSLFLEYLDEFIIKVKCFGFHFATIDMRENARVHHEVFSLILKQLAKNSSSVQKSKKWRDYQTFTYAQKTNLLSTLIRENSPVSLPLHDANEALMHCLQAIQLIPKIQQDNGEKGLNRYIISNTTSALDVLELLALFHVAGGFSRIIPVDIVPLFESINDLENAANIMQQLYRCDFYRTHLKQRNHTQVVMLGFSDGTKDGGYVAANWSIYKTKLQLTALSRKHHINIIFFDGRGGPPGRGGGNTHAFYRSLGKIKHTHPQLTIQGQTISAHFGACQLAKYNIEQLLTAGLEDLVFPNQANDLTEADIFILEQLSKDSRIAYVALKDNPLFVPYLEQMTPLHFYGELNIGSRPSSRSTSSRLKFSDLRAIPFVGSWSQLKQNISGYYGFGYALKKAIAQGKKSQLQDLYQHSLFFRTLVENAMMSLSKSFFPLTAYMKDDKKFGKFWQQLFKEAELTKKLLLEISSQTQLLANDPLNRESIKLREEIVLPLLIIQQFAMMRYRELQGKNDALALVYQKIILKALAANTNASRNSA